MDIFLASASPRRAQLLRQIGLSFSIQISNINEGNIEASTPQELVQKLAFKKAFNIAKKINQGIVIGADTIVVQNEKLLGKPQNKIEAYNMLKSLSGRYHQVMTGIALIDAENKGRFLLDVEITKVKFRTLEEKEIKAYIDTGESMDKAGAYGIQGLGALFVEGIVGCYYNVVGLPLNLLNQNLKKFGVEVFDG